MKIKKFIRWFISPSKKPITQSEWSITCRMAELEEKYLCLLVDVKRLEEENIETSNCIYELMENIRALDARIDILTAENWMSKDVR
jgi:hypothetical protein